MIYSLVSLFADIGRTGAGLALRVHRHSEGRHSEQDSKALGRVRDELQRMSRGEVATDADDDSDPLFGTIDGQYVLVDIVRDEVKSKASADIMAGLAARAKQIDRVLSGATDEACHDSLERFFREVHDLANEISVVGLRVNPVFEVFGALTK